ncbi:MAG: Type 4 prepilin-like protein leader peptide-processing enzyme PilD [Candidatus Magasanikbacteria bacterium GW2011_GWA2_41_55]|uniref:Type 4 prepilin-like protein leader peptide-processing enzyme PilD n=1 Tax=Candidatus Magasanikbacteria bacterium GW2011_GWA2_41_55 TaxID=1619038 RepID=A0A0G0WID8_9BACT|nr:MAG: Type 4 prepilin-like protein leader peptide-processing enzyme PilD [Candidatus Magasanikbacteria bacterium GW2011_GWA2_41_55]
MYNASIMIIIIFLLGLCIGSFLNVLICRLPCGQSADGRSKCPRCRKTLSWHELVPLASFLIQKGRCRGCAKKISWQYPALELVTAAFFVFVYTPENFVLNALLFVSVSTMIVVFMIDLQYGLILDAVIWPSAILVGILQVLTGASIFNLLSAVLVAGGFFALQWVFSKGRWIGDGDIGLGILMGLILGWPNILSALFFAYVGGAFISLFLLALRKKTLKSAVPFGVFLAPATLVALLWGSELIKWYLSTI